MGWVDVRTITLTLPLLSMHHCYRTQPVSLHHTSISKDFVNTRTIHILQSHMTYIYAEQFVFGCWNIQDGPGPEASTSPPEGGRLSVQSKVNQLQSLLSNISFHQAVVFCNLKAQAEWLAAWLTAAGYPAAYLGADKPQTERMEAMTAVREFKLRVGVEIGVGSLCMTASCE